MTLTVSWQGFALAAAMAIVGASGVCADGLGAARLAPPMRVAQSNQPPGDVPMDQGGDEAGALVVRIDRLESQLRAANGAIEELQNQQHRLEEQLKHFQEDVEFRLNGGKGAAPIAETPGAQRPVRRSDAADPSVAPIAEGPTPIRPAKRSDAFDPAVEPNAVGAPRPLGTTPPSAPLDTPAAPSAPLELSHNNPNSTLPVGPLASAEEPAVIAGIGGPPDDPKEMYNAALEAYRVGQYDQAEQKLHAFLAKNGGNRLAPDAIFYLGESYLQRSRTREAAEQYLKLTTDYAKSPRAPEGMLRLGQSLAALGNNDQACATFGEVGRRYPTAASGVKKNVEREMQKDHCGAQ